jgi:dephospho-CoA kinase
MLIGLAGFAQSGKDSVGLVLIERGYRRYAFADRLKLVARIRHGWDGAKDEAGRVLLQRLGEYYRNEVSPSYWIDQLEAAMEADEVNPMRDDVVITDVRYMNEIEWIRECGGRLWQVTRPGVEAANDHVSEHEWRAATFDATVENDGTVEDLARLVTEYAMAFEAIN